MREIKFRIWNSETKSMYYLLENKYSFGTSENDRAVSWEDVFAEEPSFLIPLQYTGLLDKNGVEIYEGDVVAAFDSNLDYEKGNNKVIFDKGCFKFHSKKLNVNDIPIGSYRSKDILIIGNIYENPELLEGDKIGGNT